MFSFCRFHCLVFIKKYTAVVKQRRAAVIQNFHCMFSLINIRPLLKQRRAAVIQGIQEIFNKFLMQKFQAKFSTKFFMQKFREKFSGEIFNQIFRWFGPRGGIIKVGAVWDHQRERDERPREAAY